MQNANILYPVTKLQSWKTVSKKTIKGSFFIFFIIDVLETKGKYKKLSVSVGWV